MPTSNVENAEVALQHEVQRKLGRCMLRLQQYERLLKSMVAGMAVAGPPEQLDAVRDRQTDNVRNRTLGTLVGMFTEQHLRAAATDARAALDEGTTANGRSTDASWASMHVAITISSECHAQTRTGLVELINLRNDLVHHFIERFNIADESSCRAAVRHLDSCYERIDGHLQLLRTWAAGVNESQSLMSAFVQSKAFEDAIVNGINPDGSVCWSRSAIVECLRSAEPVCQVGGWTSLDVAIRLISTQHRDQTPSRYGCRTWRQVLKQSGQFEVRSVPRSNSKAGQAWYRSYADSVT